jgi:hypothetical protein
MEYIPYHLIADSAFSLNKTLIKPFAERPNMPEMSIAAEHLPLPRRDGNKKR